VLIREAEEADWLSIWPFFRQIVEAGETYVYPRETTSEEGAALWMEQPPGRTVVASDENGRVVGTAKMGPNRPGPGDHIATASFMVDAAARGGGVGRALAEHVVGWARAEGYHGMQFNAVVETNTAAVALWQAVGFDIVGTVPEAFRLPDGRRVGLHLMYQRF